ncbi:MAG TPA: hypothetical protein VNK52_14360 [Hyphomicrobiaceae bacterium]|nr:hypothetical protein [Hyphomicrobiaceae bacterium]
MSALAIAISAFVVVDGDTIRIDGRRYRLLGYDTPEKGAHARCALEQARALGAAGALGREINAAAVVEFRQTGDNCGWQRGCGRLFLDGADVAAIMIADGYAVPWRGRRNNWCAWR